MQKALLLCIGFLLTCTLVFGQANNTIQGTIVDEDGEPLIGATVFLQGTSVGTVTDIDGSFALTGNFSGTQVLEITYVGYETKLMDVDPANGNLNSITVSPSAVGLDQVLVIADVAIDRKTPVAVTTIDGAEIEAKLGNQEYPEVLRKTPSVYVTKQGGGYGDARLNVRGFNQRNFAVMINGIPVNDMENGWVYWSNWAGLADVTNKLQYQRGLGATKLAVPSIGGSVNIITNPAEFKSGGTASVGVGNNGFLKASVSYSTGESAKGWAATALLSHARGATFAQGTDFQAWNYFLAVSKSWGNQMLSLTALGAPQWHHQRNGASRFDNITLRTFNDPDDTKAEGTNMGRDFNHVWGELDGEQFTWRKNFYHKPKVFLNHYWDISEKSGLKTSAYASFGRGGGTGPRGRLRNPTTFDSFSGFGQGLHDANGQVRFDDIVRYNRGEMTDLGDVKMPSQDFGGMNVVAEDGRIYTDMNGNVVSDDHNDDTDRTDTGTGFIRRASMNSHNWYGVLSTFTTELTDNLSLVAGVDYRYYKGIHYRRLENLLGADGYSSKSDINNQSNLITETSPADFGNFSDNSYEDGNNVLNYHNDGLVNWLGLFAQIEYSNDKFTAFGSVSGSNQGFKRIDYFNYLDSDPEQESDWQNFLGGTVKAGANYNINDKHNVFVNAGYFSKQPVFDNVFINFRNDVNPDIENQNVTSFELGYGFRQSNLEIDFNLYNTVWTDRQFDVGVDLDNDEEGLALFRGVGQTHRGLELEVTYQPIRSLTLSGMASIGDWKYSSNFTADITNLDSGQPAGTLTIFGDGLEVGDAAQSTFNIEAAYEVIRGLRISAEFYHAARLFAQYDIDDSQFQSEGGEIAELPAYSLVNLGLSYGFNIGDIRSSIRFNMYNALDEEYISESFTNITDDPTTTDVNEIYDNRGFWGFGRTWSAGLKFWF